MTHTYTHFIIIINNQYINNILSQDTAKTTFHTYIISLLVDRICSAFCPRLFTRQESMSLHRYSAVYNGPLSASELFFLPLTKNAESTIWNPESKAVPLHSLTKGKNARGLLFTHENGDFESISVTKRRCAPPISKVESHILDRCSHCT